MDIKLNGTVGALILGVILLVVASFLTVAKWIMVIVGLGLIASAGAALYFTIKKKAEEEIKKVKSTASAVSALKTVKP